MHYTRTYILCRVKFRNDGCQQNTWLSNDIFPEMQESDNKEIEPTGVYMYTAGIYKVMTSYSSTELNN